MNRRMIWVLCLTFALVASLTLGVYATYTARPELAKTSDAMRQNPTAVQTAAVTNNPVGKVAGRTPSMSSALDAKPDVSALTSKLIGPVAASRKVERSGEPIADLELDELSTRAKKLEPVPFPANIEERTVELGNEDKDRGHNTLDARCVMSYTTSFTYWAPGFFDEGDFVKLWFQPRVCSPTYNVFRIDSVEFYIGAGEAGTLIFQVDIECPMTPYDSTSGPGYQLSHPDSNIYQITFASGTASRYKVNINPDVCVNHGFFVGLRFLYWSGDPANGPTIVFDATLPARGREWYCAPGCCDFRDIGFGRIAAWVYGNTQDACTPVACTTVPPCAVTSQGGDIIETTETPDSAWMQTDPNGGCNNDVPVFGSVGCGQTVFGHVFTYESAGGWIFRDTDSYMFTLTQRDSVRWTVVSEEPVFIAIIDTNNACVNQEFLVASETANGCTTSVTTWCLDPGTYVAFVTLTTFYCPPFPGAAYRGTLECFECAACPPPVNDDCANAGTPATLPATFTGDNNCATHDCDSLTSGEGETWHAFTITSACNVVVDYCGTAGDWGNYYVALATGCPCEGNAMVYPNRYNFGCADLNIQIFFDNLPAGTYYLPVMRDEGAGAVGPYTIHVYCRACTPDAIVNTIPQTVTGTTCGAVDDCYWRVGQDYTVQINIPTTGYYEFSLCGSSPDWDTYVYLSTECCGGSLILSNDDACSTGTLSAITCRNLQAGTYYLDIEPFYRDSCGAFSLVVDVCTPCAPAAANDSCQNVTAVTLPATFTGDNTCATEDCPLIAGDANGEVWHAFMIAETCDVIIDYCGTEGFGVVYWVIMTGCPCSDIIYNDSYDYTSCADGMLTYRFDRLPPGTYWIPVVRDDSTDTGGPYTIHARCAPTCDITCPTGGVYENEPTCAADYVDLVNGGCNSEPPVFGTATCGQIICGKSGTFTWQDTLRRRDTDWFRLTLTQRSYITWQAYAEFPALLMVLDSTHCDSLLSLVTVEGYACDTVTAVTSVLDPGEYWLYISPSDFDFVDCGVDYYAWATCTPCVTTCLDIDIPECTEPAQPEETYIDCNGGCNNRPDTVMYQQILCGQTICGNSYCYEPTDTTRSRDTDWYHFSLTEAETVVVHVEAETPIDVFILNYDCDNITVLASSEAAVPCTPITLISNGALAAGDYTIFVAPQYEWFYNNNGFAPYAAKYRVTLGCPCVNAKKVTVFLNTARTNLVVRWVAPTPGNYQIYSTSDKNSEFPLNWNLETTVPCAPGNNEWTDPADPVSFKRYLVQHVCQ